MDHSHHNAEDMQMPLTQKSMDHSMPGMHDGDNDRCSMNMLFTWDWKNTCIVFKWWHIKTQTGFIVSLIIITAMGAIYEFFKYKYSSWERNSFNLLSASTTHISINQKRKFQFKRGVFYGLQVFYSFWLMLVFMTYNGWYMLAVAIGAGIGNYIWGNNSYCTGTSTLESGSTARSLSCH